MQIFYLLVIAIDVLYCKTVKFRLALLCNLVALALKLIQSFVIIKFKMVRIKQDISEGEDGVVDYSEKDEAEGKRNAVADTWFRQCWEN